MHLEIIKRRKIDNMNWLRSVRRFTVVVYDEIDPSLVEQAKVISIERGIVLAKALIPSTKKEVF